jgi:hypothetical protein
MVCENFAVHSRTAVTFDGAASTTIRDGDVGVSPGTPAENVVGLYRFEDGGQIVVDSSAIAFANSAVAAHTEAMARQSSNGQSIAIEIGDETFLPGTYRTGSSINFVFGTVVTLDGNNEPNPVFTFIANSTLVTAAGTYFILERGAKAENVLWALGTAANLGANSTLEGSILAGTAINVGIGAEIHGCAIALTTVTFENEGIIELNHYIDDGIGNTPEAPVPSTGPSTSPRAPTSPSTSPSSSPSFESVSHMVCENFAVHSRTAVTFAGAASTTIRDGDVGVSPGTPAENVVGLYSLEDGGQIADDSSAADFAASAVVAHTEAMARQSSDGQSIAIEIGDETFLPGTYRTGSSINFAFGTVVTLDGNNEPNPVFTFIASSTLVTAAGTTFTLKNGAKAENVLWALGTAATLGASSTLEGSILAGTAINVGIGAEIHGCAIALTAVTFANKGIIELNHYIDDGTGNKARYLRG